MSTEKINGKKQTQLRIPMELYLQVEALAIRTERSVHRMIIHLIRQGLILEHHERIDKYYETINTTSL